MFQINEYTDRLEGRVEQLVYSIGEFVGDKTCAHRTQLHQVCVGEDQGVSQIELEVNSRGRIERLEIVHIEIQPRQRDVGH